MCRWPRVCVPRRKASHRFPLGQGMAGCSREVRTHRARRKQRRAKIRIAAILYAVRNLRCRLAETARATLECAAADACADQERKREAARRRKTSSIMTLGARGCAVRPVSPTHADLLRAKIANRRTSRTFVVRLCAGTYGLSARSLGANWLAWGYRTVDRYLWSSRGGVASDAGRRICWEAGGAPETRRCRSAGLGESSAGRARFDRLRFAARRPAGLWWRLQSARWTVRPTDSFTILFVRTQRKSARLPARPAGADFAMWRSMRRWCCSTVVIPEEERATSQPAKRDRLPAAAKLHRCCAIAGHGRVVGSSGRCLSCFLPRQSPDPIRNPEKRLACNRTAETGGWWSQTDGVHRGAAARPAPLWSLSRLSVSGQSGGEAYRIDNSRSPRHRRFRHHVVSHSLAETESPAAGLSHPGRRSAF